MITLQSGKDIRVEIVSGKAWGMAVADRKETEFFPDRWICFKDSENVHHLPESQNPLSANIGLKILCKKSRTANVPWCRGNT